MGSELFELHAQVCRALANAKRLEILNILRRREMNVGDIVAETGLSKANISQHLSVMRAAGILQSRRTGLHVFYRITSSKVSRACDLMREVLMDEHRRNGRALKNGGK